jgi:hypothetical protein
MVSCLWSVPGTSPDSQNLKLSRHNGRRQTSRRTCTRQRRVYHGHQKGCRARRLCVAVHLVPGRDGFRKVVPSKSLHGADFDASECAHGVPVRHSAWQQSKLKTCLAVTDFNTTSNSYTVSRKHVFSTALGRHGFRHGSITR